MNEPLPKLGRLALCAEISKLAVAAATAEVPNHAVLARAEKLVEWMRAGCPPKPPKGEKKPAVASADVQAVFGYWCVVMRKAASTKLTDDRVRVIAARLAEGATVEQCKLAIDGCKNSPHHMGKNDQNTVYNSIDLIFGRGMDKLDDFASKAPKRIAGPAPYVAPKPKPTAAACSDRMCGKCIECLRPPTEAERVQLAATLQQTLGGIGKVIS